MSIRSSLLIVVASLFFTTNGCSASYSDPSSNVNPSKSRQVSWKPRAFVYEGFLTDEECDHLISLAKSELKRSAVADNLSGESKLSEVRTSSGMFIRKGKDPIVSGIEDKIAAWTFLPKVHSLLTRKYKPYNRRCSSISGGLPHLRRPPLTAPSSSIFGVLHHGPPFLHLRRPPLTAPPFLHIRRPPSTAQPLPLARSPSLEPHENGEDIQVLRYEHGQKYDPHYDYFTDKVNIARGGHRMATVLMYLTDVEKGGETVFPSAEEPPRHRIAVKDDDLSACAQKGIAVKPRRGDALLFFSLHPNATPDQGSLHAGCPVLEGEKFSATKWIHVDSFDTIVGDHGGCADSNDQCERWAALGECTKNPEYMVGTTDLPGTCRRSCKVC